MTQAQFISIWKETIREISQVIRPCYLDKLSEFASKMPLGENSFNDMETAKGFIWQSFAKLLHS